MQPQGPQAHRLQQVLAAFLALVLFALACPEARGTDPRVCPIDAQVREKSVETLRRALDTQERWVKVHAAEYLVRLDYPQGVREEFLEELSEFGHQPKYRVGIWRVLARAAFQEQARDRWIAQVRLAFDDPDGPDRLHAVESLAKLGYRIQLDREGFMPRAPGDRVFQEAARAEAGPMAAYARWVLANSGRRGGAEWIADLLASPDGPTRTAAAYALRHLKEIPAEAQERLSAAAAAEPQSPVRVFLVTAAAVHAGPDRQETFRQDLIAYARRGSPAQQYQACETLAQIGGAEDLPLLAELLDAADADVRSAAANAILRIGRRFVHRPAAVDWAVIALYAAGMLAVGWYYARRTATSEDYLLGARKMRPTGLGLSLFATMVSTISYLTWPGEIIKYGPMVLFMYAAHPLTFLVVGWLIIPTIMRLKVTSAYEILETRLGLGVRMLGSLFFLSLRLLWMAVIIYTVTAKVLVPLVGLPAAAAPWVALILGAITVVYTSMGGLRAVVVTDVAQTLIMLAGALITLAVITLAMGGVGAWWPDRWPDHWPQPEFGYDPGARMTMVGVMLASFTWWVCTSGSDQMAIQRYLATRDAKAARRVLLTSLTTDALVGLLLSVLGLALLAYFNAHPYYVPDGQRILTDADQLFPRFVVFGLPVGVTGLVLAALLAAAMSSLSSGVNSTCSVITVDFIERFRRRKGPASERQRMRLVRWVSVLVGAAVVVLSLFVGGVKGNLLEIAYKVVNLLVSPLFGLFFMAMFVPWAKGWATMVGAACGLAVVVSINYWEELTGTKGISFLWAMPLGFIALASVASLLSLLPVGRRRGPAPPGQESG